MNLHYKVFANVCASLGILCIVIFSSLFMAWSPLDKISIYWKDFSVCLMIWSGVLSLAYVLFRKLSIANWLLYMAAAALLSGLIIYLFVPEQVSPEMALL